MSDRFREVIYMGVLSLVIGLLWTVAWAQSMAEANVTYLPSAKHNVFIEVSEKNIDFPGMTSGPAPGAAFAAVR